MFKSQDFVDIKIPYSGKLSWEKTFANFAVLWLLAKVFSVKFGGVMFFDTTKQVIRKNFLHENLIH